MARRSKIKAEFVSGEDLFLVSKMAAFMLAPHRAMRKPLLLGLLWG